MDQNLTPRGGPPQKRMNFGLFNQQKSDGTSAQQSQNPFGDITNATQQQQQSNNVLKPLSAPLPNLDDSLDDLTFMENLRAPKVLQKSPAPPTATPAPLNSPTILVSEPGNSPGTVGHLKSPMVQAAAVAECDVQSKQVSFANISADRDTSVPTVSPVPVTSEHHPNTTVFDPFYSFVAHPAEPKEVAAKTQVTQSSNATSESGTIEASVHNAIKTEPHVAAEQATQPPVKETSVCLKSPTLQTSALEFLKSPTLLIDDHQQLMKTPTVPLTPRLKSPMGQAAAAEYDVQSKQVAFASVSADRDTSVPMVSPVAVTNEHHPNTNVLDPSYSFVAHPAEPKEVEAKTQVTQSSDAASESTTVTTSVYDAIKAEPQVAAEQAMHSPVKETSVCLKSPTLQTTVPEVLKSPTLLIDGHQQLMKSPTVPVTPRLKSPTVQMADECSVHTKQVSFAVNVSANRDTSVPMLSPVQELSERHPNTPVFGSNDDTTTVHLTELNKSQAKTALEQTLNATFSDIVEISSVVRNVVEAEVPATTEKIELFSDKLSNLDFMIAEYAVAMFTKQSSKVKMPEITDSLCDCVRMLIGMVNDANKEKYDAICAKDRADFEYTLNVERQKAKNLNQEREMLCARLSESEENEKLTKMRNAELEEELQRCMRSLDEADSLENQLLEYKAKYYELCKKFNVKK